MDYATLLQLLDSTLRLGTPLLLACLAGLYSERAGIFDIGLEGKMLMAAMSAGAVAAMTGSVWLGLLAENGSIIADPVQAFSGRLDVPEIKDDADTCTITISYESRLIDLTVARTWRYTHESQQVLFPGDLGFEYVTAIQDREITWGRG